MFCGSTQTGAARSTTPAGAATRPDPRSRPAERTARQDARVRKGLRRSLGDHILRAGLPLSRATALRRETGTLRPASALGDARRSHRGFPRLKRVRGMEAPAPPLLRSFPHRGAPRAGLIRGIRLRVLGRVPCETFGQKGAPGTATPRKTPKIGGHTRLQDGLRMFHKDKCPLRFQTRNLTPKT